MVKSLLVVAMLLLGVWLMIRLRRPAAPTSDRRKQLTKSDPRYHAVAIQFPEHACAAAKALAGERFLASEPPPLPLPDCDAKRCECNFKHYDDRRAGYDRRSPFNPNTGASGTGVYSVERRQGKDRRKDGND